VAYAHWQRIEFDPRVPMGEKQRKKDLYEEAVTEYRSLALSFTMSEFLDSLYSSYKLIVNFYYINLLILKT